MSVVQELKDKALEWGGISREEALLLVKSPLWELAEAADEIRRKKCGQRFDICTIINGKCGRCSEDCKYCAQSAHYQAGCGEGYGLLPTQKLLEGARYNEERGVLRYSIVTSGRKLSDREVEQVCESIVLSGRKPTFKFACLLGCWRKSSLKRSKKPGLLVCIVIWSPLQDFSARFVPHIHMRTK